MGLLFQYMDTIEMTSISDVNIPIFMVMTQMTSKKDVVLLLSRLRFELCNSDIKWCVEYVRSMDNPKFFIQDCNAIIIVNKCQLSFSWLDNKHMPFTSVLII